MNKRKLALLISKHPLLRKLTEDKTIPNSAVARLIVEELMEAQTGLLKSALGGIRRDFRVGKQGKYIDAETNKPVYPYGKLSELEEEEQAKYKNAVNKKVQAFLAQQNPKTKAKGEELENQIDTVIDKEIGIPQGTEQKDDSFNSLDIPKYGNIIELALKEYESIPIEELDSLQKLTVALTHRYFDNRAMTEQVEPKKIFLGTLGRMVGATEALPSKTYEDFKTFLDYADKQNSDRLQKNSPSKYYQPPEKGRLFDVLINIMKDLSVRAKVQQYITETKSFQSDKEQPKTAKEPESQPKTSEIIKQMADELIVNNVDIDWDQDDLDNVVNLVLQGVELEPEVEEEIQTAPTGQQEEIIAAIENEVEKQTSEKPVEQPQGDTDNPEVFDPEAEDLETLITTSKALIDEFYDKDFLQEQGILINAVLKQLAKIVEKEEQEKAARRSKKPEQAGQDLQEQDQEPFNEKERTKIQIDLKSFLRLIKKAKAVLKKFDDLRNKGSIASSGYKKDFIKILVQLQGNIKTLVEDLTPYTNLTEAVEKSDLQKKWDAIEVGYEEATKYLSNIIQAGTETQESFDMENNVKGAYGALMSITGYFPSVNPFGAKTTSGFDEYENNFNEAVDEVKGTIRDILEVTKGTIGRTATQNAIQGLKTFSGQIQNIFGEEAKSTFSDVVIKPNAPAAETGEAPAAEEPTAQPDEPAAEGEPEDQGEEQPPEVEVEEEFLFSNIKDIRTQLTSKKADIEKIKKLLAKADSIEGNEELVNKYYEAFLLWYLLLNEREATLQEVFWQKIPIKTREKTTEEKYKKAMEKLKKSNEEYFNTIKEFHQSLPPTTVQKFYQTFETVFGDEEINIAIDKTFIDTFSKRLNLPEKTEPGEFEVISDEDQKTIKKTAAEEMEKVNQENPEASEEEKIKQAEENTIASSVVQAIVDDDGTEEEAIEVIAQELAPDEEEEDTTDSKPSLAEMIKFLNDKRDDIVLRHGDEDKNYIITDIEENSDGDIDIIYKNPAKNEEQMLTASEYSIEDFYKAFKAEDEPNRFKSLTNIYDSEGELTPFSFKIIEPFNGFEEDEDTSLSERIEKLIKPLIKEMLTKGNKK
jgi:hypothetical protein